MEEGQLVSFIGCNNKALQDNLIRLLSQKCYEF